MKIDIENVRTQAGLSLYELSALLGSCHTTQMRVEACEVHRPETTSFYWLLQTESTQIISSLLDRWLYETPKSQEQVRLLQQIARRHKGESYGVWLRALRMAHPEFF